MNTLVRRLVPLALVIGGLSACGDDADPAASSTTVSPTGTTPTTFRAEVWADNWFALYVDGVLVGEDSVPITTERSFNAETITFTATYPFTLAMVSKDYIASDSGLEYIGTGRQQIGDGGFIAQITDVATGRIVAVTDSSWVGLVVHRAPLDAACASSADPDTECAHRITPEPAGWAEPGFDASTWTAATEYTAAEVGTKDGYDTIEWDAAAHLIWSDDLRLDNTILWRHQVTGA